MIASVTNLYSQSVTTHNIHSSFLQEDRSFRVWLPKDYDEQQQYHVLYVLDTYYLFDVVTTNVSYLSQTWFDHIPATIVVAIDYKTPQYRHDIGLSFNMSLNDRGNKFYGYINEELIPYVNKTYSTSHLNTIVGHSYTATYLLYNIIQQNNNFQQYIFLAPEKPDIEVSEMSFNESYIRDKKFVFVTAGDDLERRNQLADDIRSRLKQMDTAVYIRKATVNATHMSMPPFAMPLTIDLLFDSYYGGAKLDVFVRKNNLLNAETLWNKINDHNQQLYRCAVRKNANNAMSILNKTVDEKNYALARNIITTFTLSKDANLNYPNANLLEILGNFLEQIGDINNAAKYYAQSVQRYLEEQQDYNVSFNVRRYYAKNILAPQGHLAEAWEILNIPESEYSADDIYLLYYEKGRLSAKYNYQNEEGIKYLETCLQHKEYLADEHWIEEHYTLFFIAQCYSNLNNKERAIEYIHKALAIDPINEQYLLFRNKEMEESENP